MDYVLKEKQTLSEEIGSNRQYTFFSWSVNRQSIYPGGALTRNLFWDADGNAIDFYRS
jgi:hypothetical protein